MAHDGSPRSREALVLGAGTGAHRGVPGGPRRSRLRRHKPLEATPFSDAFLAMVVALIAALGLQGSTKANKQSERFEKEKAQ